MFRGLPALQSRYKGKQVRTPVAHHGRKFANDKSGDVRTPGFDVLIVDAVVPDERIGHRDDLALVRWIGQDFLITGHRGVEADFAASGRRGAESEAAEYRTVFKS